MTKKMDVLSDASQAIGNTPIVQLRGLAQRSEVAIYGKLECMNPFYSVKDRTALYLIEDAEKNGSLRPGDRVVASTSGNLGHSLAAICALRGYKLTCIIDSKTPAINKAIFQAMGADVEYVDTPDETGNLQKPRIAWAKKLGEQDGWVYLDQYDDPATARAHYVSTGPEIYKAMGDQLDVLVGCVGTGGHLCGTSRYLKERHPDLVTVAVEPVGSVIFGGTYEPTKQNGVGLSFTPDNYDPKVVDFEMKCSDELAFSTIRKIARTDGLLLGGSSGGVLAMAARYVSETKGPLNVLCLLPDGGIKYIDDLYQ